MTDLEFEHVRVVPFDERLFYCVRCCALCKKVNAFRHFRSVHNIQPSDGLGAWLVCQDASDIRRGFRPGPRLTRALRLRTGSIDAIALPHSTMMANAEQSASASPSYEANESNHPTYILQAFAEREFAVLDMPALQRRFADNQNRLQRAALRNCVGDVMVLDYCKRMQATLYWFVGPHSRKLR